MRVFDERKITSTNLENLYRRGYNKGRVEQLEHDVSMLENLLFKSQDCSEFRENLSLELKRIHTELDTEV